MKVLLAVCDLYDTTGGGQTFYRRIVEKHPSVDFFFFSHSAMPVPHPPNVHPVRVLHWYRNFTSLICLEELAVPGTQSSAEPLMLKGKEADITLMLDMAASVRHMSFDAVEIPDFMPLAAYLPEAFRYHGVSYSRLVLSLHGTLSMSLIDNWPSPDLQNLDALVPMEDLLLKYVDLRYAIGRGYAARCCAQSGKEVLLMDPACVFPALDPKSTKTPNERPSLYFIGRKDRIKGPDTALHLAWQTPRDLYKDLVLVGQDVAFGSSPGSDTILRQIASNRAMEVQYRQSCSEEEMSEIYDGNAVVLITSRYDTFNFVAIEALFRGCPVVVSASAGVCAYLDSAFPGLPYLKLEDTSAASCLPGLTALLSDYVTYRDRLVNYLLEHKPKANGLAWGEIYDQPEGFDEAARDAVHASFAEIVAAVDKIVSPKSKTAESILKPRVEDARTVSTHFGRPDRIAYYETLSRRAMEMWGVYEDLRHIVEAGACSLREQWFLFASLVDACSIDRVSIFRHLCELELEGGDAVSAAAYMLRLFRWTGYAKADELKQTQQVLTQSGFPQEAVALDLMFGAGAHSPEQSTEYLKQRLGRRAAATDNPCYILDDRRANKGAKAGIVVSLYKAASKLPFFMRSLNNVRLCSKAPFEVLFIDSGSPQDELAAYKAAVAETRLECLYARTDQRETIQAAWNRGLGLSRAPYVTFLGVDEMLRPDALDTLVRILDAEPGIDWVQGHGVITAVDKNGAYDRDVMPYSRTAPSKYYHYLDCTYLSYVGGLYRRSIHERLGYYDPSFRAAGDTEFKNRITPHINLKTVPETLGWFLDYPESRASQSATAEIEDVRAWYLYKSPGGIRYAYEKAAPNVVAEMLRAALGFRRTFSTLQATDVDYAKLLGEFYDEMFECRLADVQDLHRVAGILRQVYRCVDDLGEFGSGDAIFSACTAALDRLSSQYRCMVACEWLLESSVSESCDWHFWFGNDLRMLQHSNAWKPRFLA